MVTNLEICFAGCKRSINDNTDEHTGERAQESEDQRGLGMRWSLGKLAANGVNMSSGVYVFPAY